MIVGADILMGQNAILPYPPYNEALNVLKLQNGVYDDLLLSRDADKDYGKYNLDNGWQAQTAIYAAFNGDTLGGNLRYRAEQISEMRLKRRRVGTYNWITLATKHRPTPVNDETLKEWEKELNNWVHIDWYADGRNTEYEYAFVPIIDDAEQDMFTNKILSSFDGAVLTDGDISYHLLFDASVTSTTRTQPNSVVETMSSRYPYVIYGSDLNYEQGNFTATVLKYSFDTNDYDGDGGARYRKQFVDWCTNKKPKILKLFDGRSWMANIINQPSISYSDHYDKVAVAFDFVEIGSLESSTDLYRNGFIAEDIEGS